MGVQRLVTRGWRCGCEHQCGCCCATITAASAKFGESQSLPRNTDSRL